MFYFKGSISLKKKFFLRKTDSFNSFITFHSTTRMLPFGTACIMHSPLGDFSILLLKLHVFLKLTSSSNDRKIVIILNKPEVCNCVVPQPTIYCRKKRQSAKGEAYARCSFHLNKDVSGEPKAIQRLILQNYFDLQEGKHKVEGISQCLRFQMNYITHVIK